MMERFVQGGITLLVGLVAVLVAAVLGVLPEPPQFVGSQAAAKTPAPKAPAKVDYALRYPRAYGEFREGFLPEFYESFRINCGKEASSAAAEDACAITFNVMVEHHFGAFSKEKVTEIMKDSTHEEWVGFAAVPPDLKAKIERALVPMIVTRVGNKTIYK